jgi:hypothetical protein
MLPYSVPVSGWISSDNSPKAFLRASRSMNSARASSREPIAASGAANEPGWSQAVGHRFVRELFAGAVPDAVMARYLIQDHRFLDSFLKLLGAARHRRYIRGEASLRPVHRADVGRREHLFPPRV